MILNSPEFVVCVNDIFVFSYTQDYWIGLKPKMPKYFEAIYICGHLFARAH